MHADRESQDHLVLKVGHRVQQDFQQLVKLG